MRLTVANAFRVLLFLGLFVIATKNVSDPDFWWHLRAGRLMAETHTIPHSDPSFSHTAHDREWVAEEWLSELVFWGLFQLGGFALLSLLFSVLVTGAFGLAFLRSPGKPYIAGFATLLGALASLPILGVRPQMFTLLFLSVYVHILETFFVKPRWWILAGLPLVMLFWVNLHGGFFLGLAVIIGYLIGKALELAFRVFPDDETTPGYTAREVWLLAASLALCVAAVGINPNGFRMLSYPFETLANSAIQGFLVEWLSPDFHELGWQPLLILLFGLLGLGMFVRKRFSLTNIGLILASGYAALRSVRNVPLFSLLAIPILAGQAANLLPLQSSSRTVPRPIKWALGAVLLLALAATLASAETILSRQTQVIQGSNPVAAVDWILENNPEGNIYNTYHWGGYLIWRLFPKYGVIIDGRSDMYEPGFIRDYVDSYYGRPGWQDFLKQNDVQIVLVEPGSLLAAQLGQSPEWRQVLADDISILFVKR